MSKQAEEDYKALELYLKQAEEEISLTLSGTFRPQDFCCHTDEDCCHGDNNNDPCTSDLTGSSNQNSGDLDLMSTSTSSISSYQNKGEITNTNKHDLPGLIVDSGYSSQHSNDLDGDLSIGLTNNISISCYQCQGEITQVNKHDLAGHVENSTLVNGHQVDPSPADKPSLDNYHTNRTSLTGYHYIPEISHDNNDYCFPAHDLLCRHGDVGDSPDNGTRSGGCDTFHLSLHDNNWNLQELTAAVAEEIRVPEAERKIQNTNEKIDSEKPKVVLGEWNDASDDSSSLADDGVPIATSMVEDSVSLLSDVSLETTPSETEFALVKDQRSPSAISQRSPSANEFSVEVVVHDINLNENSPLDINSSNNISVQRHLNPNLENVNLVIDSSVLKVVKNPPLTGRTKLDNWKSEAITTNSGQSYSSVTDTISLDTISSTASSSVKNKTEESFATTVQSCTTNVVDNSRVDNYVHVKSVDDSTISQETVLVDFIRSPTILDNTSVVTADSTVNFVSSTPVDNKSTVSSSVVEDTKVELVRSPDVDQIVEVEDSRTVQNIRQGIVENNSADYSISLEGLISESELSPVIEDSELNSHETVADSTQQVEEAILLIDQLQNDIELSSNLCNVDDINEENLYDDANVYDNVAIGETDRCGTPTFVPSVDRTERIISLTLNQHRVLRRSRTLPNFSPSKKQKYHNSSLGDNPMSSSQDGGNYVFRDSYLRGSTSSSPGGLLVTDIDEPTPVFNARKLNLSSTAVQTSFDDSSNPSSPQHTANLSHSIGTNTTDSLERPKTRAKRQERLKNTEISIHATTEVFPDSVNCTHVTPNLPNHISAIPNHMVTGYPAKNMASVIAGHVTDGNITPTNHMTGFSTNHVTVTPFNHMTKVSTTPISVIPSNHATINHATHDATKNLNHFTPKPQIPAMDPVSMVTVTSPVMSPVLKPTNFPEHFQPTLQFGCMIHDESPEMQVVVNATSPVLLRRRPSNRYKQREIARKELEMYANDAEYSKQNKDSKFMNNDMSKTWDGVSRKKWKQYYAPIMQSMLQNGAATDENCNVKFGSQSIQQKTLLDQMHKKYCAYQYAKRLDIPYLESQPLMLKSSPPPPDRMKSRSWLLKNYAITLPDATSGPRQPDARSDSKSASPSLPPSRDGTLTRRKSQDNQSYSTDSSRDTTPTAQLSPSSPEPDEPKLQPGKEDAEIEAVQACRWLKEAGFPQYTQMYDDGHFPVNIASVEKEHDFLDKDSLQPLVRRLNTLNKCAIMRVSTPSTKKGGEDSDDEDQCALSDKWKYQYNIRRWSRKDFNSPEGQHTLVKSSSSNDSLLTDQNSSSETDNSPVLDTKVHHTKGRTNDDYFGIKTSTPVNNKDNMSSSVTSPSLRRAASERIKGAKNFLKRVESLKNNRKTKRIGNKHGTAVEISGPVIMDSANMKEKIRHLNCKDLSPSSENGPSSPESGLDRETAIMSSGDTTPTSPEPWSDETTNYKVPNVKTPSSSMSLQELSDIESVLQTTASFSISSDSDEPLLGSSPRKHYSVRRNHSENNLMDGNTYDLPPSRPARFPKELSSSYSGHGVKHRTGSYNLGSNKLSKSETSAPLVRRRGSADPRLAGHRTSYYDNVKEDDDLQTTQKELDLILHKLFQDINGLNKAIYGEDAADVELPPSLQNSLNLSNGLDLDDSQINSGINSSDLENDVISGTVSSPESSDHDIPCEDLSHDDSTEQVIYRERRDSGVGSSLTRTPSDRRRYRIRWHSFQKSHRPSYGNENIQLTCLSICQLMVLQKLSLIKLTGLIEKYSPNRPGWNWTVPRFMKRHKVPDYKDKIVFGVPLLVTLQRTGQSLPQCILHAMRYLRKTSPEAVGIFRKPGVRSRIQKLKNELEANPEMVNFEDVQDYDVADLLKQYFRDLPECLLTNKLSEIFINIFIYLPADQRVEALQSSVLLLPDENREVLESLLLFLSDVSQYASEHQMTASNLAVCLAPSLFMMGGYKIATQSPSPRRPRKNLGVPDARELLEQKAAHECLSTMIVECKKIFTISTNALSKCRFSYIEQGNPVTMEAYSLRSTDDVPGYQSDVETCIQGLQKESHDKFRGWVSTSCHGCVDVSYKKVADGHPLRLWKFQVDVEAPPEVALDRLKDERQHWDEDLLKWRCIERLDEQTDVFQYSRSSMPPHPSRDFVVLRSARKDLPKGACCLVSFSVEHPKAELIGGVRAVELASHFLIEPCGAGKSRITHITRVDLRGRTPEWYKKSFGHVTCGMLDRIKDSFKQTLDGPDRESTV